MLLRRVIAKITVANSMQGLPQVVLMLGPLPPPWSAEPGSIAITETNFATNSIKILECEACSADAEARECGGSDPLIVDQPRQDHLEREIGSGRTCQRYHAALLLE